MSKDYFVYTYEDPRNEYQKEHLEISFNYRPFYVGKGKDKRHLDHLQWDKFNRIKSGIIQKLFNQGLMPLIRQVKFFDSDKEAKEFEVQLIAEIGTRAIISGVEKRGPLSNLTKGGDGGAGWKYCTENSPGYHERLSARVKEYMNRPEVKERLRSSKIGKNNPQFGKKHTEEQILKIRKSTSDSKKNTICITDGVKNKYIHRETVIPENWIIGMSKGERERKISESVKGKIHINNGIKSKMIKKEELPAYLLDGWKLGRFGVKVRL